MNVYGQLEVAQLELLASDPSVGVVGRIWLNTTSDQVGIDKDGSTIVKLVDVSTAQTLTNKTLTAPTITGAGISTSTITTSDLDGGTASNTSRITAPQGTTAAIAALTRKKGTFCYDTTLDALVLDDGTTLGAISPVPPTTVETKLLVSDHNTIGTADMADTFSLTNGEWYRITAQFQFYNNSADVELDILIKENGNNIGRTAYDNRSGTSKATYKNISIPFKATATGNLTFSVSSLATGSFIGGGSSRRFTWYTLEHLRNHVAA